MRGNYAVSEEVSETLQFKTWSFFRVLLTERQHRFNGGVM